MSKHSPLLHRACCPFHSTHMWWPAGMGGERAGPLAPDSSGAPSFVDETPKVASPAVDVGDVNTRDLFEDVAPDRWVVVRGGTVLAMTNGRSLPAHDVMIRGGVIDDVVPAAGNAVPPGAVVVDATGKFVIPGLAEMHTHPILAHSAAMFAPAIGPEVRAEDMLMPYDLTMLLYLAAGVTRIEIMAGTAEELALRESIRRGRIRGPAMRIASPVIDGSPQMQPAAITLLANDANGARKVAQTIVERGFDFAKPYSMLNRETFTALAEECRRLGIRMNGHVPKAVGVEDAIALGQTGIAHMFEFFYYDTWEKKNDPAVMSARAKLAAAHGVDVQTTLCASSMFEYDSGYTPNEPRIKQYLDPVLRFLMSEQSPFIQGWRANPVLVEAGRDSLSFSVRMTQALLAEGVRILPGTDMPGSNLMQGYCLHEELRMFVDLVGMKPIDALHSATVASAEHQGEGAVAGKLARGMRGDLVVLDRDPSVDIGATREVDTVVIGRSVLRKASMMAGIERARARFARMPVPEVA